MSIILFPLFLGRPIYEHVKKTSILYILLCRYKQEPHAKCQEQPYGAAAHAQCAMCGREARGLSCYTTVTSPEHQNTGRDDDLVKVMHGWLSVSL